MIASVSIICMSCVFATYAVVHAPQEAQNVSPGSFVGTWVGLQTWTIDDPSPSALEPQPVELTIELMNGRLAGALTPFFGGSDGAIITDATIAGDELQAWAAPGPLSGPTNRRNSWQEPIRVFFRFKHDGVRLTGTADILMGDVNWLKFSYELSLKRSRY